MINLNSDSLYDLFKMLCPDLEGIEMNDFKKWIEIALPHVSACRFGSFYDQALVYYAAHLIALNGLVSDGGSSGEGIITGPMVSRKEGDLSITYAWSGSGSSSSSNDPLGKTIYGQLFSELVGKMGGSAMTRFSRMCR